MEKNSVERLYCPHCRGYTKTFQMNLSEIKEHQTLSAKSLFSNPHTHKKCNICGSDLQLIIELLQNKIIL